MSRALFCKILEYTRTVRLYDCTAWYSRSSSASVGVSLSATDSGSTRSALLADPDRLTDADRSVPVPVIHMTTASSKHDDTVVLAYQPELALNELNLLPIKQSSLSTILYIQLYIGIFI